MSELLPAKNDVNEDSACKERNLLFFWRQIGDSAVGG